jgi:hypothetical protein
MAPFGHKTARARTAAPGLCGAFVVFTHAVAIFVFGGVFDRTQPGAPGPEIVQYSMIAILSCQRDRRSPCIFTFDLQMYARRSALSAG